MHLRLHAKDLMLIADYSVFQVCSEKCEGTENLRLHLYKVHGRGEMFRCEECNFETSTKAVYIKHLRYLHCMGRCFAMRNATLRHPIRWCLIHQAPQEVAMSEH